MAAGLDEADQRRRAAQGVDLLEPEEGCRALERLLDSNLVQCAVMPVDWGRFQRTLPEGAGRDLFEELTTSVGGERAAASMEKTRDELRRKIAAAPPRQRQQIIQEHVRQQVTRVLGLDPAHPPGPKDGLTALGMDSLMAVELKNRLEALLGASLPSTIAYEHPDIAGLTEFICSEVLATEGAASTPSDNEGGEADETETLSREDLERSLLSELKRAGY
jgi:acyl carrier protein